MDSDSRWRCHVTARSRSRMSPKMSTASLTVSVRIESDRASGGISFFCGNFAQRETVPPPASKENVARDRLGIVRSSRG